MVVYGFKDEIIIRAVLGSLCAGFGGGVAHSDDLSIMHGYPFAAALIVKLGVVLN